MREPRASEILKPYQTFDLFPILEEFNLDSKVQRKAAVIMLSAPPGAGKTSALRPLFESKFGDRIGTVVLSEYLYAMMRVCGLPETNLDYNDFKALPMGRERLIAASNRFKSLDRDIYPKLAAQSDAWREHEVVLVDNVGFGHEVEYFADHCVDPFLIELMLPHHVNQHKPEAKPYFEAFNMSSRWPFDSRFSLAHQASALIGPAQVYVAINSAFAIEQLNKRVFERDESLSAGNWVKHSTFGSLLRVWHDQVEAGAVRDLFAEKFTDRE